MTANSLFITGVVSSGVVFLSAEMLAVCWWRPYGWLGYGLLVFFALVGTGDSSLAKDPVRRFGLWFILEALAMLTLLVTDCCCCF